MLSNDIVSVPIRPIRILSTDPLLVLAMRRRGAPERACEFTHRLAVLHYLLGLVAIEAARELGLLPDPPLPPGIVGAGRIPPTRKVRRAQVYISRKPKHEEWLAAVVRTT